MPISTNTQLAFLGVDACTAPHLVDPSKVQSAVNIDFDLVPGAAAVRRGSVLAETFKLAGTGHPIIAPFRNLNNPDNIFTSPFYFQAAGQVFRGVNPVYTPIASFDGNDCWPAAFKQYTYFPAWGTSTSASFKDDGTTMSDWIKQSPAAAPAVSVGTLTPLVVTSTYTIAEGTSTGTGTGTALQYQPDATTLRLTLTAALGTASNLDLNGTNTIGDWGVDTLDILFSDPAQVNRISRDYSIGDTAFKNYWHTEFTDGSSPDAQPDAAVLIESVLSTATFQGSGDTPPSREDMVSQARDQNRPTITLVSAAANSFNLWACPRTKFDLINASSAPKGWGNIQAVRLVVECSSQIQVQVANWNIYGAKNYPKTDSQVGYTYYQTWATLDANGAILGESAPSPASAPLPTQNGQVIATWSNTMTGTQHGITHGLLYAQGGYLNDAYCVATTSVLNTGGTATAITTVTDSVSDIDALTVGRILNRNIMSRTEWNAKAFSLVSEPFVNRLFCAQFNRVYWTPPNMPDVFPRTSYTDVSHTGDNIRGMIVWGQTLCIVNRDSVYELRGSIFEGTNANWTLIRTASRHGNKAFGAVCKTPYGIPLLDYEGLFMYTPGQGIDQPLDWVVDQIGDVWRGATGNDPAVLKGNRVPALSAGFIDKSVAAFFNDKLYLGLVTGTNTGYPDTVFVLNFRTRQCQWYQYPWQISSLYFDPVGGRMIAGMINAYIMAIESGIVDTGVTPGAGIGFGTTFQTPITWNMTSRAVSVPTDSRLENLAVDMQCPSGTTTISATYDGVAQSVEVLTPSSRDWFQVPLNGTLSRDVTFGFSGTQAVAAGNQTIVHQAKWTAIGEPERLQYFRTEDDDHNNTAENLWTSQRTDMEVVKTSTAVGAALVVAVTYVDNVAVMTNTITGPTVRGAGGRQIYTFAFPWQVYGNIAHTVYTASGDSVFKLWTNSYDATVEPDRLGFVSSGITTYPSNQFLKTWVAELNPLGSCTGRLYCDDLLVLTQTFSGTTRQVYNVGIDIDTSNALRVARKVEMTYTAAAGGVLKHYSSNIEVEPKPFLKKSWAVTYKKSGGATQLDMARFWSLDAECPNGTTAVTATWTIDGVDQPSTTITIAGRQYRDRIAFPPGGRGYLFQLRLTSPVDIEVFKSNLDIEMIGVKGFSRRTYAGTPAPNA